MTTSFFGGLATTGPHDTSKCYGISRDGKVAVGMNKQPLSEKAWRIDIDWAMNTTENNTPPLFNELQVMEDLGTISPSLPSAANAASNMACEGSYFYDKVEAARNLNASALDWCGSFPVGHIYTGQNMMAIQWYKQVLYDVEDESAHYLTIPDFGGSVSQIYTKAVSSDGVCFAGFGTKASGLVGFWVNKTLNTTEEGDPVVFQVPKISNGEKTLSDIKILGMSSDGLTFCGTGTAQNGRQSFAFVSKILNQTITDEANLELESAILPRSSGGKEAEAHAMTSNGNYIAGFSETPHGKEAAIWFRNSTTDVNTTWHFQVIGALKQNGRDAIATGIVERPNSTAGSLMVTGMSNTQNYASEAFVWMGKFEPDGEDYFLETYFRDLEYTLTKTGAGEASGMGSSWVLNECTGVSDDGSRMVGWGTNPEGGVEAWLVTGFPYDELNLTGEA
mmetsp:Transcript_10999/g.15500  ORF Transcript_10999/g.15500 Transcript_10999/m.15500 type:complete len:448 (+) Transcript_10999:179-1522(+)